MIDVKNYSSLKKHLFNTALNFKTENQLIQYLLFVVSFRLYIK